ncbi:MAG: TPM domain-containing protein [Bacteroidales bacterium]|nr:TPM domain-containing protein [Bacteroidales bacterium]
MTGVKRILSAFVLGLLALALEAAAYAGIPQRTNPPRLVNDFAGIFSSGQTAELESVLVAFDDSTSNQIAVVTVSDLEGYDPNQYAVSIGLEWGVGNKQFNNGIVLLVKPKNSSGRGQVAIQVGYGLEGAIPDIYAKKIVDNVLVPAFREGDYYGGVRKACDKLMGLASGEISVKREFEESLLERLMPVIFMFLMIAMFMFLAKAGRRGGGNNGNNGGGSGDDRRVYIGPLDTWLTILGTGGFGGHSGGRSGGFGGVGGFGGGGFGGFGGGSFGGGGASGSW